jgi:uncharacterized protein YkwD
LFGPVTFLCLSILLVAEAVPPVPPIRDLTIGVQSTGGGFRFNRAERCFMRKINNARAKHGLGPASSDPQLGYVARLHAKEIARAQSVYHDNEFGQKVTNWYRLGQNTGRGMSCRSVHRAFMQDPTHKEIVLGPWNFIGVGISSYNGRVYVQQLFESSRNPGNIYNTP